VALYGLYVICIVLWVVTGFEVNNLGTATFSVVGEAFNVTSKAALALAFAVHIGTKGHVVS